MILKRHFSNLNPPHLIGEQYMKYTLFCILIPFILLNGCSKPTAEELFTAAQNAYQEVQKVQSQEKTLRDSLGVVAIDLYMKVVKEYPDGELGERAMFMVATIRQNEMHDFANAVGAYKQYVETYPNGSQVPIAMFLVGYLFNNELHNIDSAAAAYRRFLAKFPNNEMAMSAEFELNNLGKSPDEFLPKPAVAETPAKKKSAAKPKKQ